MVVNHFPSTMVIIKIRVKGDKGAKIVKDLPFNGFFTTDTIGFAGGLWLLWKMKEVEVFLMRAISWTWGSLALNSLSPLDKSWT